MIPWFIVNLIAALAWPFGYEVNVLATARSWRWGADRVFFFPRDPDAPSRTVLAPYRGGPLMSADPDRTETRGPEGADLGPSGSKSHHG